jgi:ubiquitin carboxyl-terminal hydrolase 8
MPAGLVNSGNSCYINAAVQCLSRVEPLTRYLLSADCRRDRNPQNPLGTGGRVLDAYCKLLQEMQNSHSVSAAELKREMGKRNPLFADYGRHDSTEFCISLLDAIHEDINQSLVARGRRVDVESLSGMELHRTCNESKVVELFHGETETEFRYGCGYVEHINEPLVFWTLSFPSNRSPSLDECIRLWMQEQELTGDNAMWCDRCQREQTLKRKCKVVRFANVLVIQLRRFTQKWGGLTKDNRPLSYPLSFKPGKLFEVRTQDYELTCVICHSGTLSGGHYTARVRGPGSQWYEISDDFVRPIRVTYGSQCTDSDAMTLFYQCSH